MYSCYVGAWCRSRNPVSTEEAREEVRGERNKRGNTKRRTMTIKMMVSIVKPMS